MILPHTFYVKKNLQDKIKNHKEISEFFSGILTKKHKELLSAQKEVDNRAKELASLETQLWLVDNQSSLKLR